MKEKGAYEKDMSGTGVRRIKDDTLMQNFYSLLRVDVVILSRCGAYTKLNIEANLNVIHINVITTEEQWFYIFYPFDHKVC